MAASGSRVGTPANGENSTNRNHYLNSGKLKAEQNRKGSHSTSNRDLFANVRNKAAFAATLTSNAALSGILSH